MHPYQYPVPPPPKKGLSGKIIFAIVAGVISVCLCGLAGAGVLLWQGGYLKLPAEEASAASFSVGDCLNNPYGGDVRKVACTDPEALRKVTLVVEGKSERDGKLDCYALRNPQGYVYLPTSRDGKIGTTLCLGRLD